MNNNISKEMRKNNTTTAEMKLFGLEVNVGE
jgi:hypothetical protein